MPNYPIALLKVSQYQDHNVIPTTEYILCER
jgi:hypothetical protein